VDKACICEPPARIALVSRSSVWVSWLRWWEEGIGKELSSAMRSEAQMAMFRVTEGRRVGK